MKSVVEVAICTRNRAELLRSTLLSVLACESPNGWTVRLIVVDNGSTDETGDVMSSLPPSAMSIELLKEPKVGHTHARNCAIEHSMGDLVIWTDDDVCVRETWIQRYVDACESAPDVGFWGAAIRPVFPGGMPDWIEENWEACAGCFASRDLGAERIPLSQSTLPYGANFAVRGDVLRSHRFDINLGRRGDLILGEDELEYMRRLMDAGVRGEWVPDNALQHVIPSERATERYVWNYFLGQGLRLGMQGDRKDASWLHRMRHALGYHFRRNRSPSPVWFAHLACWGLAAGKAKASAYGS